MKRGITTRRETTRMKAGDNKPSRRQHGYILLVLVLAMSLLVIAAAIIAPTLAFEIRRDREEEMIHRGVQYSRAIRNYATKTGRYPMRLEDLQDTNGVRYIRKLYKDPITGDDFKLLHMSDMPSVGGIANLNPNQAAGANPNGTPGTPDASDQANPQDPNAQAAAQDNSQGTSPNPSQSNAGSILQSNSPFNNMPMANNVSPGSLQANGSGAALATGGVIFGVASKSKSKTIREFDKKNHYNQWLFFYYPPYGGGRELTGPTSTTMTGNVQPVAPGAQPAGGLNPGGMNSGGMNPGSFQNPATTQPPTQTGVPVQQ